MSTEHTPGPWHVSAGIVPDSQRLIVESDVGLPVCALSLRGVHGDINRMAVNARLIAAAPDLLAMALEARALLERGPDTTEAERDDVWRGLSDAIARATGATHA